MAELQITLINGGSKQRKNMAWTKKRDPLAPVERAFHHPDRCMNCGHLKEDHHDAPIGCTIEGGTKYIEDEETGEGRRACSCEQFIPAPEADTDEK